MASLTQWTWVWASSERWWRTGKPGVLHPWGWAWLSDWTTLSLLYILYLWYILIYYIYKSFWFYDLKYIYREREKEREKYWLIMNNWVIQLWRLLLVSWRHMQTWVWWRADTVIPGPKLAVLRPMKLLFQLEPEGRNKTDALAQGRQTGRIPSY